MSESHGSSKTTALHVLHALSHFTLIHWYNNIFLFKSRDISTNVHIDKIPLDWHLAISAHFFALTNTFNSCANGESANFSILLSEVQAPVLLWRSRTQTCRRTWQTLVRCRWRPAPWWRLALELSDAGYLKKEENGSTVKCPTSVKGQGWWLSLFFFEHSSCWKKNEITYFSGHHGDVVPFGHFPVQGL